MTPPGGGSGSRGRPRVVRSGGMTGAGGAGRTGSAQKREPGTETPIVAVAQILLGLTLSCAIAMAVLMGLIGLVFLIAYALK